MSTRIPVSQLAVERIENDPARPTIIFLHESLGSIALWRDFPKKLGERTNCNVLVYDRFGYGKSRPFLTAEREYDYMESEADLLAGLLDEWGISEAILFGHSDGGSIALIAAAKYPEKIKAIITEGAHVFVEDVTLAGIREAVRLYNTTDLKARLEKYHGSNTEAMFWAWAKTWTSDGFRNWNIESFLPKVKCPALIVQGEADEYGTLEQVKKIVRQVNRQVSKYILPGVGHTPHKDAPELILEKSADFIRSL
jgi:pimeloyl-ACP methyl ester carboxylesterase